MIAATLIVEPKPTAIPPTVEQPLINPPPPLPRPKREKPVPKKLDQPKPIPKPKQTRPVEAKPNPPAQETVAHEAPTVSEDAPRPAAKTPVATVPQENTQYHPGHVSGFGRNHYPRIAKERGWEGTVTLKVHVTVDGGIGEVLIVDSSGYELLDEAAVDMLREGHATPARRGDKPVDSWVVVPYRFQLTHE